MKTTFLILFTISLVSTPKYSFTQVSQQGVYDLMRKEHYPKQKRALNLSINEGSPISGVLEYQQDSNDDYRIELIIYSRRMKKKMFDLIFKEFVMEKHLLDIPPLDLEVDKIIALCSSTIGLTFPQTDGVYLSFFAHRRFADGQLKRCKRNYYDNILESEEQIGQILKRILLLIDYEDKADQFERKLKKGLYHNYGSHYLKLKRKIFRKWWKR